MAVSNVLAQATGSEVRSAMTAVNMDGNATFLTGTVIGVDIGTTDVDGNDVHVANTQAFTSAAEMTGHELMAAWANKINNLSAGGVAGARAYFTGNSDDEYILHVEAQYSGPYPAWAVSLATPTFVAGT